MTLTKPKQLSGMRAVRRRRLRGRTTTTRPLALVLDPESLPRRALAAAADDGVSGSGIRKMRRTTATSPFSLAAIRASDASSGTSYSSSGASVDVRDKIAVRRTSAPSCRKHKHSKRDAQAHKLRQIHTHPAHEKNPGPCKKSAIERSDQTCSTRDEPACEASATVLTNQCL